jgi:hypothetical protein
MELENLNDEQLEQLKKDGSVMINGERYKVTLEWECKIIEPDGSIKEVA